jgi:hypothetical protein
MCSTFESSNLLGRVAFGYPATFYLIIITNSMIVGGTHEDTDNSPHNLLPNHHHQQHDHRHHQNQIDMLQSAADAAAALENSPLHQANVFSLDDVQPGTLGGTDL